MKNDNDIVKKMSDARTNLINAITDSKKEHCFKHNVTFIREKGCYKCIKAYNEKCEKRYKNAVKEQRILNDKIAKNEA